MATQRRLAAIVSADVAGYSRLMGADEEGTLTALKAVRRDVVDPKIAEFGGRLVKTTGDGLLLEFNSVVDAVRCVLGIQVEMSDRNRAVEPDKRIAFRMGVNQDDIIFDEGDIFGDGVNVAARLQEAADPGGICISGRVFDDVHARLDARFEDSGELQLKNIARPYRVWRWLPPGGAVIVANAPLGPVADKPSIAVLPFSNMSGFDDQEFIADGITEDVITELSRFKSLFVIARSSTFTYKGKSIDIRQVGRELGARYVVEGSVRRGGNRVRVTAQLLEADTGRHVWADRYDRSLEDVFALQEELTRTIVAAIDVGIFTAESTRIARKRPESLVEWELLTKARGLIFEVFSPEVRAQVHRITDQILQRNPLSAEALGMKALADMIAVFVGQFTDSGPVLKQISAWSTRARELDLWDPYAVAALGRVDIVEGRLESAVQLFSELVEIHPNSSLAWLSLAVAQSRVNHEAALAAGDVALKLNPRDPLKHALLVIKGDTLVRARRFSEAETTLRQALALRPRFPQALRVLIMSYFLQGRLDEAKALMQELLKDNPTETIRARKLAGATEFGIAAFRAAGMPEG